MNLNGERLRQARTAAGISRAELYRRTKVSIETIKRAEDNEPHDMGSTKLARIAAELGVTMDSLFDHDEAGSPA